MATQKLQANRASVVVPSDTVNIPSINGNEGIEPCVLYVGTGGDLKILTGGNDTVTLVNVQGGTFLPISVLRVFATGTTALNIISLW